MAGLIAFGALAAIAPTAQAQVDAGTQLSFTISEPDGRIRPQIDTDKVSITWTYQVTGSQLQATLGDLEGGVVLDFDITCEPQNTYLQVLSGTQVLIPVASIDAGDNTITETFEVSVSPSRDAPGLKPITCNVDGTASGSGNALPPADFSSGFSVIPEYYGLVEAKVTGSKLQKAGPQQEVSYLIDVTNFGNAETRVTFNFPEGGLPSGSGWDQLLPDPILLDAKGGERQTSQATFTVSTPYKNGWNNLQGSYTLQVNPVSTDDREQEAESVTLNVITRVRGVYVPGFEPIAMIGAVLGIALLARFRRDQE